MCPALYRRGGRNRAISCSEELSLKFRKWRYGNGKKKKNAHALLQVQLEVKPRNKEKGQLSKYCEPSQFWLIRHPTVKPIIASYSV